MSGKEVCRLLNIPKSTLRFYRNNGFVNPRRLENGYFDYSQNDVVKLFQIVKFRRLSNTTMERINLMFEDSDRFNRENIDAMNAKIAKLDEEIRNLQKQKEKIEQHINILRKPSMVLDTIQTFRESTSLNYVKECEFRENLELVSYMCDTGLAFQSVVFSNEDLLNGSDIYPEYAIGMNDIEGRNITLPFKAPHTISKGQRGIRIVTKVNSLEKLPAKVFDKVREYIQTNNCRLKEEVTSVVLSVNNNNEYTVIFRFILE